MFSFYRFFILLVLSFSIEAKTDFFEPKTDEKAVLMKGSCQVSTGASAPCIGAIIRNPKTETFFIGHFNARFVRGKFLSMVVEALEKLGASHELEVFITGSSGPEFGGTLLMDNKEYIENLLIEKGFKEEKAHLLWLPEKYVSWIELNNETGAATLFYNGTKEFFKGEKMKEMDLRGREGKFPKGEICLF